MSEDKNALNLSLRVDIKNISPSSATIIRQRLRDTLENFVSANLLQGFVEGTKMDLGGKPEDG